MGKCRQCDKWITQTEGRRKKEFCNNTCRSNFWYGKNKKSTVVVQPMPAVLDSPKFTTVDDEPLSFDALKSQITHPSQIVRSFNWYWNEKIGCQTQEEWAEIVNMINEDTRLTELQKNKLLKPI